MKTNLSILHLLLFCLHFYAQDSLQIKNNDSIHNSYIKSMKHKIQARLDFNTDVTEFKFQNPEPFKDFNVLPNQNYNTRISLGYKWLNLAFSFAPKIGKINNDTEEKGKSKIFGLDLYLGFKKFQNHIFYRKTTGYYLSNSNDYQQELANTNFYGKYALLPDFESTQFGIENYYYFNGNKFSTRFARNQSEIQLKSAGSLVSFVGFYYSDIDGRKQNFDFLDFLLKDGLIYPYRNISYYTVGGLGYAYNFVFKKHFYLTGLAYPVLGIQSSKLEFPLNSPSKNATALTVGGMTELSLGYNTENWFAGAFTNYAGYTNITGENKLSGSNFYTMIFVGYRFKSPKSVTNAFNKFDAIFKKNK